MKIVKFALLTIFSIILISAIVLLAILLINSPGKPIPVLDNNDNTISKSLSEKTFKKIGGIDQGMFIRSKDITKPILLFLHGGPGMPEYTFFNEVYNSNLEDEFTVCYWDQRGAGISYSSDLKPETITTDQLISDTVEITNYLRKRFNQDKIYLMGHSWGTYLGIKVAAKTPELYHAYIGVAQISYQMKSEVLAYKYMLNEFKKTNNTKMIKKLESYKINNNTLPYEYTNSPLRDDAMHILGVGTTHEMDSVISGIFIPIMKSKAYTLKEKINIWISKSMLKNSTNLVNEMNSTDLTKKITKLSIPTYFISGKYDYTVSYKLSKEYLDKIEAPLKKFYTFENSAHSPFFEEPEKFINIIKKDILTN